LAAIPPLSTGAGQPSGLGRQTSDAAGAARSAAQRAFFQAALGGTQAPVATAPISRAAPTGQQLQPHAQRVRETAVPEPAPTDRIPRPGSLVNIVV